MNKFRLAAIISHPVQYQAPLFQRLARHPAIDLTVYYATDGSLLGAVDPGFGIPVTWDRPLLEGYKSKILCPHKGIRSRSDRYLELLGIIPELKAELYDGVLIHSYATPFSLLGYFASWRAGSPVLLRSESELIRKRKRTTSIVKRIALSVLFRGTSAFLSIGRANRAFYQHHGVKSESVFHTPYGVDNDFFESSRTKLLPMRNGLKQRFGFKDDTPVIIFSGKLVERKRPMDLLQAYARVIKAIPNVGLLLIGEGGLRAEIEQFIASNNLALAKLAGFKNQTELPECYICGDLFVLPAQFETWGLVVNEAMLFGMPAIVTDQVGCAADLIDPDVTGRSYPVGNVDRLSAILLDLLHDRDRLKKMGLESQKRVRQYHYDVCVEGFVAALEYVTPKDKIKTS